MKITDVLEVKKVYTCGLASLDGYKSGEAGLTVVIPYDVGKNVNYLAGKLLFKLSFGIRGPFYTTKHGSSIKITFAIKHGLENRYMKIILCTRNKFKDIKGVWDARFKLWKDIKLNKKQKQFYRILESCGNVGESFASLYSDETNYGLKRLSELQNSGLADLGPADESRVINSTPFGLKAAP